MLAFLGFLDFICIIVIIVAFIRIIANVIQKRSTKRAIITLVLSIVALCLLTFIAVSCFSTKTLNEHTNNEISEKELQSESQGQEPITEETTKYILETTVKQTTEPETISELEELPETTNTFPVTTETESTTSEESEYLSATATDIIDIFKDNQVKCKKMYDKQKIRVTGRVDSVGTDILGTAYVCLGHDKDFTFVGIQCYSKNNDTTEKIAELSKGDIITIQGIGECGSMSFSLKKAEILN